MWWEWSKTPFLMWTDLSPFLWELPAVACFSRGANTLSHCSEVWCFSFYSKSFWPCTGHTFGPCPLLFWKFFPSLFFFNICSTFPTYLFLFSPYPSFFLPLAISRSEKVKLTWVFHPLKLLRVGTANVMWYDVPEINTNFKTFFLLEFLLFGAELQSQSLTRWCGQVYADK